MSGEKVESLHVAVLCRIVESQAAVSELNAAMKSDAGALVMITDHMADTLSVVADVLDKISPDMIAGLRRLVGYLFAHNMHQSAIHCADAARLFEMLTPNGQ